MIAGIEQALRATGLLSLGGFRPEDGDGVAAATVLMVGNAGPAMWRAFDAGREAGPAPLDAWTRKVLTAIAERFGARAVFPFDRPFLPFQRWAVRAGSCHVSPIRVLVHPEFGLWFGLRGALLLPEAIPLPAATPQPSPCDTCRDRPCLDACPVEAFVDEAYDVDACRAHLAGATGADCLDLGCRARRACPVGGAYRYAREQARFHMEAFMGTDEGSG